MEDTSKVRVLATLGTLPGGFSTSKPDLMGSLCEKIRSSYLYLFIPTYFCPQPYCV